jgi:biotin carboxyl carrier protein
MNYNVHCGKKHSVKIDRKSDFNKPFPVTVDKGNYLVEIRKVQEDGCLKTLMLDHRVWPVEVERSGNGMPVRVFLKGVPYEVDISRMASTRFRPPLPEAEISGEVRASLPGQIIDVLVGEGETVRKGQAVAVLDAMKMENEITAPRDGRVKEVAVRPGQILGKGDRIIEIE